MLRIKAVSFFGLTALTLSAGQIQIGGVNGLTGNYVTGGGACTGAGLGQLGFTGCAPSVSGNAGGGQRSYNNVLFTAPAFNGNPINPPAPQGPGSLTNANNGGVVFNLINDGLGNQSLPNNYWATTTGSATAGSVTIPIGIYGVSTVWTMLNDYWGPTSGSNTTVRFVFADNSQGTVGVVNADVALNNSGQIRSAVNCKTPNPSACPGVANGLAAGTTAIGGVQVTARNIFKSQYDDTNSIVGYTASSFYDNTAGNVVLDDQKFDFGITYSNKWLAAVVVSTSNGGLNISRAALSAITVDSSAVPEPSTVFLLLAGLGGIGIARFRRK